MTSHSQQVQAYSRGLPGGNRFRLGVQVVAVTGLARAAMAAAIMGDTAIAAGPLHSPASRLGNGDALYNSV